MMSDLDGYPVDPVNPVWKFVSRKRAKRYVNDRFAQLRRRVPD